MVWVCLGWVTVVGTSGQLARSTEEGCQSEWQSVDRRSGCFYEGALQATPTTSQQLQDSWHSYQIGEVFNEMYFQTGFEHIPKCPILTLWIPSPLRDILDLGDDMEECADPQACRQDLLQPWMDEKRLDEADDRCAKVGHLGNLGNCNIFNIDMRNMYILCVGMVAVGYPTLRDPLPGMDQEPQWPLGAEVRGQLKTSAGDTGNGHSKWGSISWWVGCFNPKL